MLLARMRACPYDTTSLMRSIGRLARAIAILVLVAAFAIAAETGNLKLEVIGENGEGAKNPAQVIDSTGKEVAKVTPGATVAVAPGDYHLVLPIIGGKITKDNVRIETGRTHTVLIDNVAALQVSVKDRHGNDPGFGVTVTSTDLPHTKVASFLTGDKYLFAPSMVDVHVDAPPQGYDWHAIKLGPGNRALLTLGEVEPAELDVQTVMSKLPLDGSTRVVVLRKGTQSKVAESGPGKEHHFKLDPGDYDIYVENRSGKGKPFTTDAGIHLDSGAKVERTVPLD
jgi:translation initiation factor IF-1